MKLNVQKTVLLLIDVQNDFCPGGALAVKDGDAVVAPLNRLSRAFAGRGAHVIATQDWHPQGHISFASSHNAGKPGDVINTPLVEGQVLWPDHCVQGTKGAEFHLDLDTKPVSIITRKGFNKSLDSYSSFFENDRKTKTGLEGFLRLFDAETVVIGGIATDYCVFFSAMDCKKLGFNTVIVSDAVRGVGFPDGSVEAAVSQMKSNGIMFVSSDDLMTNFKV